MSAVALKYRTSVVYRRPQSVVRVHQLASMDLPVGRIDGRRHYQLPNGEWAPSITTVLTARDKSQLEAWIKRVGETEANAVAARASRMGNALHDLCDTYLAGHPIPANSVPSTIRARFARVLPVLNEIEEVYATEHAVYHVDLRGAGRMDNWCWFRGHSSIMDFKASDKAKNPKYIDHYFVQTCFYAMCVAILYPHIPAPDQLVIVNLSQDEGTLLYVEPMWKWVPQVHQAFKLYRDKYGDVPVGAEVTPE
jgi:hypothetical protein